MIALAAAPVRARVWIVAGVTPDELSGDDIPGDHPIAVARAIGRPSRINTAQSFRFAPCGKRKAPYIIAVVRKRGRAWRGALGDGGEGRGEKFSFGIGVSPNSGE